MWQLWTSGILGLWIAVSAFMNFSEQMLMWNLAISGLLIAVLSYWAMIMKHQMGAGDHEDRYHRMGEARHSGMGA